MGADQTMVLAFYRGSGSMVKAAKALHLVGAWGICREALAHRPTQEEYSEYWGVSRATATREFRAFKACVPEGVAVDDVWESVRDQLVLVADPNEATARLMGMGWSM